MMSQFSLTMNPAGSPPSMSPAKRTFACIRCSERKVRCNKENPCQACVKHNVPCVFGPPKPARRHRVHVKDDILRDRLKQYEALLQEKGIDPKQVSASQEDKFREAYNPGTTVEEEQQRKPRLPNTLEENWRAPPTPASSEAASRECEPHSTVFKPHLLHGQSGTQFVDNSLWSRVAQEIHEDDDDLDEEEDSANDPSDGETSIDHDFEYVLGSNKRPTPPSHPSAEHIRQLWHTFVENVNPLSKFVHVPSLHSAIEKAIANIECVPKGFEALMFAIYSMAVYSLPEDDCREMFGESKAVLCPRYVAATKAALSRAKFMSTTSIVVLQALVLHILSIREAYDARAVWSLTGLAIRISENMGMRVDGSLLGLSPFETEIRRRIWWQIKMHDFRAAELSGQAKFRNFEIDESTPAKPTNCNDSDMWPSMPHPPIESTRPTEMLWVALRSDLATFAASQKARIEKLDSPNSLTSEEFSARDDLKIKDSFIKRIEDMLETKYLRFCDPSNSLQLMTLVGGRLSINLIKFIAHHPRRWAHMERVSEAEQNLVWDTVISLLEQINMMQSNQVLRCFAWNLAYFIQWHAIIHILDTLRADPLRMDAVKTWRLIDSLYTNNLKMLLSVNKPVYMAVGNLCLKAYDARILALTRDKRTLPNPPEYITKLREQREAAKARREAMSARRKSEKSTPTADFETPPITKPADVKLSDTDLMVAVAESVAQMQPQPNQVPQQPVNLPQANTWTGDDAFWLSGTIHDNLFATGAPDMMNIDTDAILTQGYWNDSPPNGGGVVDWEQWDAWMGNIDPNRSTIAAGPI